jgi:hypothetical protein
MAEDATERTNGSAPSSVGPSVSRAMESAGKVFLFVGAACYVAGLLVVNFYLRQFGTSDFSLLRTRFVLTGAISLLPLAVFMVWIWSILIVVGWNRLEGGILPVLDRSLLHDLGPRRRRWLATLSIVPLAFLVVYARLLRFNIQSDAPLLIVLLIWTVFVSYGYVVFFALLIQPSLMKFDDKTIAELGIDGSDNLATEARPLRVGWAAAISILTFVMSAMYLWIFATAYYPRISGQLGGGQPAIVQLVVLDDFVGEVEQLGIPLEGLRSNPLPLLWEGESFYLVAFPDHPSPGWTAQVNKSLLAGVLSVPQERRSRVVLPPEWSPGNMSFSTPVADDASASPDHFATPVP